LKKPVVQKQLELIKLRNQSTAFGNDSIVNVSIQGKKLIISRTNLDSSIKLTADFEDYSYTIE
ncbi:MAG: glycosidase, partial [Lachnospiraceae bacterium]|nr:glycosidase [Lachnospiraceae bacterium]